MLIDKSNFGIKTDKNFKKFQERVEGYLSVIKGLKLTYLFSQNSNNYEALENLISNSICDYLTKEINDVYDEASSNWMPNLEKEKQKFLDDIQTQKDISDQLAQLKDIIDRTYKEIYDFLIQYLKEEKLPAKLEKIEIDQVRPIDKTRVINRMLNGVPQKNKEDVRQNSYRQRKYEKNDSDSEDDIGGFEDPKLRQKKALEAHLKHCSHCSPNAKLLFKDINGISGFDGFAIFDNGWFLGASFLISALMLLLSDTYTTVICFVCSMAPI